MIIDTTFLDRCLPNVVGIESSSLCCDQVAISVRFFIEFILDNDPLMNLNSLRSMVERRVICLIRMDEEIRYKILRLLADNPDVSQRELAEVLGVSLGKANYCLQALKEKGLVKARNFKNNPDKRRYIYVLTPKGIDERATVAARFLKRKLAEYELLQLEIEQLRKEVQSQELPVEDAST